MLRNIVKVSPKLHNFFIKNAHRHIKIADISPLASVYILGEDGDGVIVKAIYLVKGGIIYGNNSGCCDMARVPVKTFIKGVMKIYKHNLIPSGLARVGRLPWRFPPQSLLLRLQQMSEDSYVLSYTRHFTNAVRSNGSCLEYVVVKPKGTHVKRYRENLT